MVMECPTVSAPTGDTAKLTLMSYEKEGCSQVPVQVVSLSSHGDFEIGNRPVARPSNSPDLHD